MSETASRALGLNPQVTLHCRQPREAGTGSRTAEPVSCGVPFPRGALPSTAALLLLDGSRCRVPLQARTLDRWSDGSLRWVLLDWLASTTGNESLYTLSTDESAAVDEDVDAPVVEVDEGRASVEVATGEACFRMRAGGRFPFDRVTVRGEPALAVERCGLIAQDGSGLEYQARISGVRVVEAGPVRVAVELIGDLSGERGEALADLRTLLHFYRRQSTVRIEISVTNPRRALHPGNLWELGDGGSIFIRDLALSLVLPPNGQPTRIGCSPELGAPFVEGEAALELYQDSSGGENWRSSNHVNREARVPLQFRGYRLRRGQEVSTGLRASPLAAIRRGERHLAIAPDFFWQRFPQTIEASAEAVTLHLFPHHSAYLHELQGGERRTDTFTVALGDTGITGEPLAWCRSRLLAYAEPAWYAEAQAVTHLLPLSEDTHADYLALVDLALEGDDNFMHKREVVDEYGWRHFGDIWADHEAVANAGSAPLISHYNNQYDTVRGLAVQFLRSADARWHGLMDSMARHVTDIDIYHTDRDKSAYNHGLFWHTVHYTDAGRSTHRSYPASKGVSGGGPSGGHLYTSGLMLHYFLTGCERSREAVLELGRYVIDADDGKQSVLRWVDHAPTGHVTLSGFGSFHGAGRSPANSLNALLDAHRLTGERCFLDKAEELVGRCIHPADDLGSLDLLDAERRWFYTMFLQSLGRYLSYKSELGEIDASYAYARAALLHYTLWALEHERPYLSRAEALEFPTETWAAQDLRKCEMFQLAAQHASAENRARLQERAAFFFDHSVETLLAMPTRSLCRPMVLLLACGYRHAYFERHADEALPRPATSVDFGRPRPFASQKQRVKRKLLVGGAVLAALAGLIGVRVAR